MVQRFKIEDLVDQDATGVIFRAFDSETGQTVALRRFFPHGLDGGGLSQDEQVAYAIALDRLIGINHPALRSVVCGGCDPVDGMPYIATEWIDGVPLAILLENAALTAGEAADLLGKALEVCQLFSEVLAEEAVWMETDLRSIVVGTVGSGRGATFWISPFTWLGASRERGLDPIIALCEQVMDWKDKAISHQDAKGLGGWLRWLRGAARTTSLHEVRENLAASLGVEPPVPAKRLVRQAFTSPPALKKKRSRLPLWTLTSCLLFAIGGGTWAWMRKTGNLTDAPSDSTAELMDFDSFKSLSSSDEKRLSAASAEDEALPELTMEEASSTAAARQAAESESRESVARLAAIRAKIDSRGGVFTPQDGDLLIAKKGAEVILEGALRKIAFSSSGKTMYLLFSENASTEEPRGGILLSRAPADLNEADIKPLLGKKIRLSGQVRVEPLPRPGRPVVFITDRAAIQEVE